MERVNKTALLKYLLSVTIFGFNGIVASRISMSSYNIVFMRTLIGTAVLALLFIVTGGRFHVKTCRRDALFVALSGAAMGSSWMFLYEAYKQIGVSISTLLCYTGPVLVMIASPLLFKEKLTLPKVAGFAAVVIGILLINGISNEKLNAQGLFCGAMSGVTYFFMIAFNKQSKHVTGMENAVIQLAAAFVTVAVFVGIKQRFIFDISKSDLPWILFLGLVNTGLGCYLYFSPMTLLPAQTLAVCGYIEPLAAVVFSALLLGERMSAVQIAGAVLIIGGAMAGELIKPKE